MAPPKVSGVEFENMHKICCGKYRILSVLKVVAALDFVLWLAVLLYAVLELNNEEVSRWRVGFEFTLAAVIFIAIVLLLLAIFIKKWLLMVPRLVVQIIIMVITLGSGCYLLYTILYPDTDKSDRRQDSSSLMNKVGLGLLVLLYLTQSYVLYLLYVGFKYLKARAEFIAAARNSADPHGQTAHNPNVGPPPDYRS